MRRHQRTAGLFLVLTIIGSACTGSSGASPNSGGPASPATVTEVEASTTLAELGVLPEYAEMTRPTLTVPESESFTDPVEEIFERYYLYVEATYLAAVPPVVDPDYEPLQGLVTGGRASEVREYLETWREENSVLLIEDPSTLSSDPYFVGNVTFDEAEGETVTFQDCLVDTTELVDRETGEVVDGGTRTYLVSVEMTYVEGDWRVSRQELNKRYEGVSECPDRL